MAEFDELLQYFEKEKAQFGYSYVNRGPHGGFFDVIWEFPIKDHSHGAFGQSEAKQLENSPGSRSSMGLADARVFFEKQGPLLTCAYVVLNYSHTFHRRRRPVPLAG